jgi:hypothetical protein
MSTLIRDFCLGDEVDLSGVHQFMNSQALSIRLSKLKYGQEHHAILRNGLSGYGR